MVVAAFNHPIAWFLEMLRQWREREAQAAISELADDPAMAEIHHDLNIEFWYLLPPC